jgi:hypothetical protein
LGCHSTNLKTPAREVDEHHSVGAVGFYDAVLGTIMHLARLGFVNDRAAEDASTRDDIMATDTDVDESSLGPAWTSDTLLVDGQPRRAWARQLNGAWAKLVDLALHIDRPQRPG